MEKVSFYCVNFKNEDRRKRILGRFERVGIPIHFVPAVELDDPRLAVDYVKDKRIGSNLLGQIDSLKHFVENTTNDFCVVCEDDVMISKNLKEDFKEFIEIYDKFSLNLLLLGYLMGFKLEDCHLDFHTVVSTDKYKYKTFPDDLWGAQMYLVSRKNAIEMVERYQPEFILKNPGIPYNPDWTITKYGNRLMVYPMVAVEEGNTQTNSSMHSDYHRHCHNVNYDPDIHF